MTSVVIFSGDDGIAGFEASGHSGYAESGSDIVCAAISAILQTACIGLTSVAGIPVRMRRSDRDGYLRAMLPANLTENQQRDAQVIFKTAQAGLTAVMNEYPGHVRVISRKRR